MPNKRRSNLNRCTKASILQRIRIQNETEEQRQRRLARAREYYYLRRSRELAVKRESRLQPKNETEKKRIAREKKTLRRMRETPAQRERRLNRGRERSRLYRALKNLPKCNSNKSLRSDDLSLDMNDDCAIEYKYDPGDPLGPISVVQTDLLASNTTRDAAIEGLQLQNETEEEREMSIANAKGERAWGSMGETSVECEHNLGRERQRLFTAKKKLSECNAEKTLNGITMKTDDLSLDLSDDFSIEYQYDPDDSVGPISVVQTDLFSKTTRNVNRRLKRKNETEEERAIRTAMVREQNALRRLRETSADRERRLIRQREKIRLYRARKKLSKRNAEETAKLAMGSDDLSLDMNDDFTIEYKYDPDDSVGPISDVQTDLLPNNTTKDATTRRSKHKNETEEERAIRIAAAREKSALRRMRETSVDRELRLSRQREKTRLYRVRKKLSECNAANTPRGIMGTDDLSLDMNDDFTIEYKYDPGDSSGSISVVQTDLLSNNTTRNANRRLKRKNETEEERAVRIATAREKKALQRMRETSADRELRLCRERERLRLYRARKKLSKRNAEETAKLAMGSDVLIPDMHKVSSIDYNYDPVHSFGAVSVVRPNLNENFCIENNYEPVDSLGTISVACENCSALLWKGESKGLCCLPGKIKLEKSDPPSEVQHPVQISPWISVKQEKGES